ncbi:MAG: Chemotaxis protein methyltransferase CheR [Bryobacterales bacterium]|nr:Chemotaxis protein methyltransferase CheR [Bryobacterales bacterium]
MAFVLVQHLDPLHESALAEILGTRTKMPVVQVKGSQTFVQPNSIYVIPPNAIMRISGGRLDLQARGARNSRNMPIDAFLNSLAADQKSNAYGVILSGTASDGTLGLKAIKDEGGITFAQDERSAAFPSMPRNAIAMGAVDFILPPDEIAKELVSITRHSSPRQVRTPREHTDSVEEAPEFQNLIKSLRAYSGVDFTHYKHSTTKRRIERRMTMHRVETLAEYCKLLDERPAELAALFDDLLINVTEFFRDPEAFEFIRDHAIPALLKGRPPEHPVRVWVPACSTGEEVYSLAICLREAMDAMQTSCVIQIFGTDISEAVIDKARAGIYAETVTSNVSPERLRNFFVKLDSGYQIRPNIRECCVFSLHNVTKDPPLSRMDIVSCRNLLIYLGPVLQKRVVSMFQYALRPGGYLILGESETPGSLVEYFTSMDKRHKVFIRKAGGTHKSDPLDRASPWPRVAEVEAGEHRGLAAETDILAVQREANRVLLTRYAPAGFLVDHDLKIIEFRGIIGPYLGPAPGGVSFHLLKMLREDLTAPVRAALDEARSKDVLTRRESLRFRSNGEVHTVSLTVMPVLANNLGRHYLVLFEDPSLPWNTRPEPPPDLKPAGDPGLATAAELEQDLANTRQYLQSIIEELRSANEEIQSSNEELQSTNEELQTAKEELQSTNEELTTVNEEMQSRNSELSVINNDLVNLLSSISVPIVMLGSDLRVRRFTPLAEKAFNLIPADVGRPILDIKPDFEIPDLEQVMLHVIRTLEPHEREVSDRMGRWHLMRIRPYRTTDNRIDGVVLQMLDIDALQRSLDDAKAARNYAEAIVDTVREPLVVLDSGLVVQRANRSFYETFRVSPQETESRHFYELGNGQWNLPNVHAMLDSILAQGDKLQDAEVEHDFERMGRRTVLLTGRSIRQERAAGLILLAIEDVTERKQAAEARYRRLFEAAQDGIIIIAAETGEITDANPYLLSLFGYSRKELVGTSLSDVQIFRNSEEMRKALRQVTDHGVLRIDELLLPAKDGRLLSVELVANVYSEGERHVIQFNVRNISDRKKLEQQLRQTAKLESLGLLAGGIAHDFNNLLTGIMGNASLAVVDVPAGSTTRHLLEEVVRASERAAELTRQMLAYAGKGKFVVKPVKFSNMIRDITTLINTSIPRNVRLQLKLKESLPPVEADPGQMQQVVMNLIINAAESIREGSLGVVTVSTSVVDADAHYLRTQFTNEELKPGQYVCLRVKDNGTGMDDATRAKIFDPFFTTKFTGRGLGLAAVQGIVRGHKGGINVKTALGRGTTFEVIFPAAQPKAAPARAARTGRSLRGSGTVLVVDDEAVIREMARTTLERHGYAVLLAENGESGVATFRENAANIALVILDMTMPVMNGPEALRRIKKVRPDVRILVSSGFDESEAVRRFSKRGLAGFIQKPYTAVQLAEKVKAVLQLTAKN